MLSGCTNTINLPTVSDPASELTSVKSKYSEQLASIHVGDYVKTVKKLFPNMSIASDNMKNTIYEFSYQQEYLLGNNNNLAASTQDKNSIKLYKQKLQFYFINNKLVHWQVK